MAAGKKKIRSVNGLLPDIPSPLHSMVVLPVLAKEIAHDPIAYRVKSWRRWVVLRTVLS